MKSRLFRSFVPLAGCLVAGALARAQSAELSPPAFSFGPLDTVVTDVAADGTVWALGANWKMRVGHDGATFFPKLGERAPRHLPLVFGAPLVTAGGISLPLTESRASLGANSATIDRGVVDEVYEFAVSAVEQRFVIEALPNRGEVRVRIPVTTDLEFRGRDDGLRFEAPGFGPVRYGDATIVDAENRRIGALSEWKDGVIEITVPASFVATAQLPLVVDPLISPSFDIGTTGVLGDPDVAYDASNDVWLVVYQEGAAGNDHDILARRLDGSGNILDTVASDATTEDTTDPSVANASASNQFLVAWRKEKSGLFDEIEIQGRTRNANGSTQSAVFTISNGSDNEQAPVVGGGLSTLYFVVWQENPAIGADGENISGARVTTGGVVSPVVDLATTVADETQPTICKQADQEWMVLWTRQTSGHGDIHTAIVNSNGVALVTDTAVETETMNDSNPHCAANRPDGDFVVSWERPLPTVGIDVDLVGGRYSRVGSALILESNQVNYTNIEEPGELVNDNRDGLLARDGERFVLLQTKTTSSNKRVSSFNFDNADPIFLEESILIPGFNPISGLQIASREESGGVKGRSLIVLRGSPSLGGSPKIAGMFFDSLNPGGVSVVQTGCGGLGEPKLTALSSAAICEPFSFSSSGFNQALLFVGVPANIPLCPGQSGCALGTTPNLALPFGNGTATFTLPCDPSLFGVHIAMTGVSLISSGSVVGMCGPPKYTQKFLTSDTLVLDFQ